MATIDSALRLRRLRQDLPNVRQCVRESESELRHVGRLEIAVVEQRLQIVDGRISRGVVDRLGVRRRLLRRERHLRLFLIGESISRP